MSRLEELLDDKGIDLVWRDELPPNPRGWVRVGDVGCSRTRMSVMVPRRRRNGYHFAEVIHEVAHLELWRWTGVSPTNSDDVEVRRLALEIGKQYRFSRDTIASLYDDLGEGLMRHLYPARMAAQGEKP